MSSPTFPRILVWAALAAAGPANAARAASAPPFEAAPSTSAYMLDVRRFGAVGDGIADDAPAFAAARAAMRAGSLLWAPPGAYRMRSTLDLTDLPRHSSVQIDGALRFVGDIPGVVLNGYQVHVAIRSIESVAAASSKAGLVLKSVRISEIDVWNVEGFRDSVHAIGKLGYHGVDGVASNRITLGNLAASQERGTCVRISVALQDESRPWNAASNRYGYVNENYWNLTFMTGHVGVDFVPAAPVDRMINGERFGGNKFLYPHFEVFNGPGAIGMHLDYTSGTVLVFPRFEGGSRPEYWVKEERNCTHDVLMLNDFPDASRLRLDGTLTRVFGDVSATTWDVSVVAAKGQFVAGEVVTGRPSGALGVVASAKPGSVHLLARRGAFVEGDALEGTTSGASANAGRVESHNNGDTIFSSMLGRGPDGATNANGWKATDAFGPNAIYVTNARDPQMMPGTLYFDPNERGQRVFSRWAGGVRDTSGVDKNFGLLDPYGHQVVRASGGKVAIQQNISLIIVEANGPARLELEMPSEKEVDGFSVDVNVNAVGGDGVAIVGSGGSVQVPARAISTTGYYRLTFYERAWHCVKLSGDRMQ